jgi:hypothetical protein
MLRMRGAYNGEVKKAFDILRSEDTKYSWLDKQDAYKTIYEATNIVTTKYTAYGFRDHTLNGDQVSDIAVAYYRNWIYLVVNNPEEAYKMLGSKSKKEFDTYEKFTKWIEQYKTVKTKDNTVTGYSYKKSGGYNTIIVRSSENMRYRFTENSVWNYKVDILGQERVTDTTKLVTKKR